MVVYVFMCLQVYFSVCKFSVCIVLSHCQSLILYPCRYFSISGGNMYGSMIHFKDNCLFVMFLPPMKEI